MWIVLILTTQHWRTATTTPHLPVRLSSFPSTLSPYNLNIPIQLLLDTSTEYHLAVEVLFNTVAGVAISCILAYLCGKY